MARQGLRIDLLTYGQGEEVDIPGTTIHRIPAFGVRKLVKPGPSLLKFMFDIPLSLWTLARLFRHRYDIVHAHEEAVFFCRFLKRLFRFKLVYDMHSILPQQLRNFEFSDSRLLRRLFEILEDDALRGSDAVITICPSLADYADRKMVPAERHFLIENCVFDTIRLKGKQQTSAAPCELDFPEQGIIVLYAGTFESYQGIDILLEAFRILLSRHPDSRLVLLGGTPSQVSEMTAFAGKLGIGQHCDFHGQVPVTTVDAFTPRATMLISPRKSGTNTPLKVYQQLASGVPLVATRITAHTQVLNDDVCFMADPDPASFASAMLEAAERPDLVRQRITAAQELYRQRFTRASYDGKIRDMLKVLE
jgi:glycosyltransferase involved in cell wall biosynthesis